MVLKNVVLGLLLTLSTPVFAAATQQTDKPSATGTPSAATREEWCRVDFNEAYGNVWFSDVVVYRNDRTYTVRIHGATPTCSVGFHLNATIRARVNSTGGGYLDTGDIERHGQGNEFYESSTFTDTYLAGCKEIQVWGSSECVPF